jgi:hypothetical protein
LEKLLLSVHLGIAALTKTPEMALDQTEAHLMAEATARVARHYPVLNRISDKAIDHGNLVTVLVGIYGTRVAAIRLRQAAERRPQPTAQVITPQFGGPFQGGTPSA